MGSYEEMDEDINMTLSLNDCAKLAGNVAGALGAPPAPGTGPGGSGTPGTSAITSTSSSTSTSSDQLHQGIKTQHKYHSLVQDCEECKAHSMYLSLSLFMPIYITMNIYIYV